MMTDNEIIKALECCGDERGNRCSQCPMYENGNNDYCQEDLHLLSLNLINRHITRLESQIERLLPMLKTKRAEAIKEFAEMFKEKSNKTDLVFSGALVKRDYTISEEHLDNLVKEMVGDGK